MILASLLSSSSFIMTNKILIKAVGLEASVVIGELCSEYTYWKERNQLSDGEWFFSTRENIEDNTGLSEYQQRKAINLLLKLQLIETKKMGMPYKTYYRLNEKNILNCYNQTQKKLLKPYKNSVPKKVNNKNLKNYTSRDLEIEEQDIKNFDIKKSKNYTSRHKKSEGQDVQNFNINKNNNKNKKRNGAFFDFEGNYSNIDWDELYDN